MNSSSEKDDGENCFSDEGEEHHLSSEDAEDFQEGK